MITIRRSELQSLISCEAAESGDSEASAFGSLFHRCVELYWDRCAQAGGDLPEEQGAVVDAVLGEGGTGCGPERFEELRKQFDRFVWSHSVALDTFASNERKLEWVVDTDVEPFLFTGTFDRADWLEVDQYNRPVVAMITDYKTHFYPSDTTFQGHSYARLITWVHPTIQEVIWRPDFIRLAQGEEWDTTLSRLDIDGWWEATCPPPVLNRVVRAKLRKLAGEAMEPTGGAACQYCTRSAECAASVQVARIAPSTPEEAEQGVANLIRLKWGMDAQKAALKNWTDEHGPVTAVVDDIPDEEPIAKTYGPGEQKLRVIDPERAVELGVAMYPKPRRSLRKVPVPPVEQGA